MNEPRPMSLLIGGVVLAAAGLLALAGVVLNALSDPDDGANIGAGLLVLASLPVAAVGLVLLLVGLVLRARARHRAGTASR